MNDSNFCEKFGSDILKYVKENYLPKSERRFKDKPFSDRDISSFTPLIKQLHENFTKGIKGKFYSYFRYPEARGAYLLGFYPLILEKLITLFKDSNVLDEIKSDGDLDVLDFASGPLTSTTALLLSKPDLETRIKITAIDIEEKIMRDGIRLIRKSFPNLKDIKLDFRFPTNKRFDIILASHLLNEVSGPERILSKFLNLTKENGIIIFNEPATRYSSTILMKFREEISKNMEWSIIYPCLHSDGCPLLYNGKYGWCHQVSQATLPSIFKEIRRASRLDPNEAKRSSLIIKKTSFYIKKSGIRVLSNVIKTPIKLVVYVCAPYKPIEVDVKRGSILRPGSLIQ